MIDPLRALIAQWRQDAIFQPEDDNELPDYWRGVDRCANELDALLSAPVGSPPPLDQESASRGGSVPGTPQGDLPQRATGDS
jgi:hypothetical protein